jgi:hypothetical protein|tara:strand:+ start:279 stop:521 length:243 start_codon:yes stop_codon:yes gene_type:complete
MGRGTKIVEELKKLKEKLYHKERRLDADASRISPKTYNKDSKEIDGIKKQIRDIEKDSPTKMKKGGIVGGGRQSRQDRRK